MSTLKSTLGLALWMALSLGAGFSGARFRPGEWYAALAKPSWTPPNALFPPVWTTLYVLMAIAAWLVWKKAELRGARAALVLFVAQLALNALWSYLFFGIHRPGLAFYEILVLWALILAVTVLFWQAVRPAGILMLPYLLWVGYASCLNFALWRMNPA